MAKKAARNGNGQGTPALPGIDIDGPGISRPRPLPPIVQGLFLPKLLAEAARSRQLDAYAERREQAHAAVKKWIADLRGGALARQTESQAEGDFLNQILKPLGYTTAADVPTGQPWTLTPKWPVPGVGIVDAALDAFRSNDKGEPVGQPRVMVELKGAATDLDRRGSRSQSAVSQAWGYLTASESARWAIVTNFVEIRLYSKARTSNHVHRVIFEDLDDPERFAEFFAVFHADGLLGTGSITLDAEGLLRETGEKQAAVTDELYDNYAEQRVELIREVLRARPGLDLDDAIGAAQTLLDRILFIAFAEDRQLIKDRNTLEHTAADIRPGSTRWRAFQDLFRAFDRGAEFFDIPRFNGELFKPHPILDDPGFELDDDRWPTFFKSVGDYDFRDEVPPDILGRLFERSIQDIEEIRGSGLEAHREALSERRKETGPSKAQGRRKREGVYYTDPQITGYLVAAALDPAWEANRAELLAKHGLADDALEPDDPPSPALARYVRDRLAWLDGLTVCDPACGSGAFLIAAYDWLEDRRLRLLDDLKHAEPDAPEAAGDRDDWAARAAEPILRQNLFGVDLSPESVEIARLSLWIRTARRGRSLTQLSENVVCGNSVVDDDGVDRRAFDWHARFPAVFARGGFDAVVGNPPYVRQEFLGEPLKKHLSARFRGYHGMADLYVYFYERGLQVLRPGGRLAFVVTNKWMKSGYGEPLRKLFADDAWVEAVVDFGHAKGFFKDADVFPCFLVIRKPTADAPPETARVCAIPRELAQLDELRPLVAARAVEIERDRLGQHAWNLEPRAVADLLAKISGCGVPLAEFAGVKPYYGIKTGFNEAFLIDTPTRDSLIRAEPRSVEIIKPYLRGQNIERWSPEWAGLWMIFTRRGIDIDIYPAVKRHLEAFRERLEPKPSDWTGRRWIGRKPGPYQWYEIQDSVEYWQEFLKPKVVYQVIQYHPRYAFDPEGRLGNDKTFFIPTDDFYLLAVLNSPLLWWYNWRHFTHLKDEALSPMGYMVERVPICRPGDEVRIEVEFGARRLIELTSQYQETRRNLLDWLAVEHDVAKPTTRLRNPVDLDRDAFIAEVRKSRGRGKSLTSAALKQLREEYDRTVEPARVRAAEARALERRLSDLVNAAYGLTPEEIRLLWATAPPRMPVSPPETGPGHAE